ncbi:MAG: FAD-dependent oxidoreductase [Candidatus Desantisbacteria bacterium]
MCGFDYFSGILKRTFSPLSPSDITFEDWVTNRFGKALYSIYFAPYSAKLWGVSPNLISADWADYRITLTSLWDVLLRLFKIKKDTPTTYIKNFYYPKSGGIGRISERIAEVIQSYGGTIHLNATVKELQPEKGAVIYSKDGMLNNMEYDYVISTIPLPELIRMIRPIAPNEYLDAASNLTFRSIRFFNLCLNKERVSENTWIYIPQQDIPFFRIQEPGNWSKSSAPAGKTSLILEIACNKGDDLWNADDKSIYKLCIDGLKRMGFDLEDETIDYFSVRAECAYPIYTLDYKTHLKKIFEFLAQYKNLVCCGRQGLFWYNAMDEAMRSGFEAADNILDRI